MKTDGDSLNTQLRGARSSFLPILLETPDSGINSNAPGGIMPFPVLFNPLTLCYYGATNLQRGATVHHTDLRLGLQETLRKRNQQRPADRPS